MLCGSSSEKVGCFSRPKSPASTAGNSTPREVTRTDFDCSLIWGELKEDVLLLNSSSWKKPLVTPEDIAKLSRAVCLAHDCVLSNGVSMAAAVSWRLFQAADNTYQGYVSLRDLQRILRRIIPRLAEPERSLFSPETGLDTPVVLWDVIAWWRELALTDKERQLLESTLLKHTVVPSDGLWAGLSIGASLRVWKTVCRSAGHLFRFHAQNYLQSTFKAIQTQGLPRGDLLTAEIEVLTFLIGEASGRVFSRFGKGLWTDFCKLDEAGEGLIEFYKAEELLKRLKVKLASPLRYVAQFISRNQSLDYISNNFASSEDESRVSLLQLVHAIAEESLPGTSANISVLPGAQNPAKNGSKLIDFFSIFFFTQKPKPIKLIRADSNKFLKVLVKQYLDLEQWRGQKAAELCANRA